MAASEFHSAHLAGLFPTANAGRLFTDSAEIRAMMLVEGALAKAQGALGVIPEISGAAIHRASLEIQIDPAGLAKATGQNGVSVPALVAAFRTAMEAPEHAQYLHWGATSQDIIDTGLMLRLRQLLTVLETDLRTSLVAMAQLADEHADLPMAGRTYGQHATPTSFGAVVAAWGWPLLQALQDLPELRARCLLVSLSGAAGTSTALGEHAGETRAALAEALGLGNPGRSWHTDRMPLLMLCQWMARVVSALAKPAADLIALTQTEIGEVTLGGSGASSTMPQKQNPVQPSAIVALDRQTSGALGVLQANGAHLHQRDGAAWFTEWMVVPQIALGAASALHIAADLLATLKPNPVQMSQVFSDGLGLIHAEALSFALATHMPRPDAQVEAKNLCRAAKNSQTPLSDLVAQNWPDLAPNLFGPQAQLGAAPDDARAFAQAVRAAS